MQAAAGGEKKSHHPLGADQPPARLWQSGLNSERFHTPTSSSRQVFHFTITMDDEGGKVTVYISLLFARCCCRLCTWLQSFPDKNSGKLPEQQAFAGSASIWWRIDPAGDRNFTFWRSRRCSRTTMASRTKSRCRPPARDPSVLTDKNVFARSTCLC